MARLLILWLLIPILSCATGSAGALREQGLADAHDLVTDRMKDRWHDAAPDEKQRWVELIEEIETSQRSLAETPSTTSDADWSARVSTAYVEAVTEYARLLEEAAPVRRRNAQLERVRELSRQLIAP